MSATIWSPSPRASCSGSTRRAPTSSTTIPPPISALLDPSVYITVPYAPKEQRLKAYIKFLRTSRAPPSRCATNIQHADGDQLRRLCGKKAFGGFVEYYPGDGMAAWKGVGSDEDQKALKAATDNAVKAMHGNRRLGRRPARRRRSPISRSARTKFQRMLADTEMVTTPVDELERIGRADLASNQKLLTRGLLRATRRARPFRPAW